MRATLERHGVFVRIIVSAPWRPPPDLLDVHQEDESVLALVDTGSTSTIIDAAVLNRLSAPRSGRITLFGVATTRRQRQLRIAVVLFAGRRFQLEVVEDPLIADGRPFGALLGRDVLDSLRFTWDGPGRVVDFAEAK